MARRETPAEVAARALAQARRRGAPHILQKALIEAGLVESGLQHEKYRQVGSGDRDSIGFLQQRPSAGWGPFQSIEKDTNQFLDRGLAVLKRGFKGSSGQLAQAVQGSAFPARYDQRSRQAEGLVRSRGGVGGGGGRAVAQAASGRNGSVTTQSSSTQTLIPGSSPPPTIPGGSQGLVPLLQALADQPQPRSSAGVQAPAFSAAPPMPGGYQTPVSGGGPPAPRDMNALLAAAQQLGGGADTGAVPGTPDMVVQTRDTGSIVTPATAGGRAAAAGKVASGGRFPTARAGKIIGVPHAGTHTLGNWQSDNAVDIGVRAGTPMVALDDGVVVRVRRHPQGSGRFAGDQVTIRGRGGNEYFYAHGVARVKPGQRVKRGQSLGVTGSANGVEHLHFGVRSGDPRKIIGRGR